MTLSKTTGITLGIASLLLIITYFVPLWQIALWAPQYPEGLIMKIWMSKLSGDVEVINGLNHYIGMKHISVEMFPEFGYMGMLVGFLIVVGLAAAIFRSGRILFFFTLLSYVYGVAALWDFWRWGYAYGHDLNPEAPIKVPDMSYQPPVIGYKNLLNFTAYSGPDAGAWIIIGVCLLATVLWWWEFFRHRKSNLQAKYPKVNAVLPILLVGYLQISACSAGPEPIRYGKDECTHCKMILTDNRFGAEIITRKGKVFKFDDLNCMVMYQQNGTIAPADVAQMVAVDFKLPGAFVDVKSGFFLHNQIVKSPMRGDVACFSTGAERDAFQAALHGGDALQWEGVMTLFQ